MKQPTDKVAKEAPKTPQAEDQAESLEELIAKQEAQYQERIEHRGEVPIPAEEEKPVPEGEVIEPQPPGAEETAVPPVPKPEAEIPLTEPEIQAATKLPFTSELRWLGEWCLRQWRKLYPGEFNQKIRESLGMVFYEVLMPRDNEIEPKAADQMFANLAGLRQRGFLERFKGQHAISFELVADEKEIRFIVGAPREAKDFVVKQIHAFHPGAEILEIPEYNIFEKEGFVEVAEIVKSGPPYFPVTTYEDLPLDPLNSITQTLSKLQTGDTAAIQVCISPAGSGWQAAGQGAIYNAQSPGAGGGSLPIEIAKGVVGNLMGQTQEAVPQKQAPVDEKFVEGIRKKISKNGFSVVIRVVVTANNAAAARTHLHGILSSFEQFTAPHLASFRPKSPRFRKHFMVDFLYRYAPRWKPMVLNSEELASIYHFPNKDTQTPDIKWLLAKSAPPPTNVPIEGTYLGLSTFRGEEKKIFIQDDDRLRHIYIVGQTGTGKTELLKHLIYQDMVAGNGLAFIDPHGDAVEDILTKVPKERVDDVIYFNPGDTQHPPGLNILEAETEEAQHLIINSFIALLYKLYDPNKTGIMGPRLERALRNIMLTAMVEKENTLVEVLRLLIDPDFANSKLPLIKDPLVKMYWTKELAQTSDFHKSETLGYFVSKFDRFVTEKLMRNIIGQPRSAFNFRRAMDEKKILLINLSKGRIGEENSIFLGLLLVPRILAAAMSRTDIPEEERQNFFLYVDEFQNFATPDFVQILSEARKYALSLIVGNQFIGQLTDEIKNAVFGNVGTTIAFRVGADDAEYLEKQLEPFFNKADLMSNPTGTAYTRLLIKKQPSKPFSMKTDWEMIKNLPKNEEIAQRIVTVCREKYGRDAEEVSREIGERMGGFR